MHCIGGGAVTTRIYVVDMSESGVATLIARVSGMLYNQEDFDLKEKMVGWMGLMAYQPL